MIDMNTQFLELCTSFANISSMLSGISIPILLIVGILHIFLKFSYSRLYFLLFMMMLSFIFTVTTQVSTYYLTKEIREKIISILENKKELKLYINDNKIKDSSKIIKELSKIKHIGSHHSAPSGEFKLQLIIDGKILELLIVQDSKIYNEYWIFYPKLDITNNNKFGDKLLTTNEIGRIHTTIFDNYIKRFEKHGHIWYYKNRDKAIEYVRKRGYPSESEIIFELEKQ